MSYVDGFIVPVSPDKKDAYFTLSKLTSAMFREFGATRVVECWGNDLPDGKVTDFRRSVKAEGDENVVFSWVEWPSKQARDEGLAKFMADPRMAANATPMPFDGKRMFWGGFDVVLDDGA